MSISETSTGTGVLFWGSLTLIFLVASSAYARYIFAKDYDFIVEVPCDAESEVCNLRDCDEYCPPNELEIYKRYIIAAKDYGVCNGYDCSNVCGVAGQAVCKQVVCNPEEGDVCMGQ